MRVIRDRSLDLVSIVIYDGSREFGKSLDLVVVRG